MLYSNDNDRPILVYSSLLFLINWIQTFNIYNQTGDQIYLVYSLSFYFLTLTSILVHGFFQCLLMNFIDKVAILAVAFLGGYIFFSNIKNISLMRSIFIVSTFSSTIILYYYGYLSNSLCFDKDENVGTLFHALLHAISSAGHLSVQGTYSGNLRFPAASLYPSLDEGAFKMQNEILKGGVQRSGGEP